ncbi:MAG: hypothetical protein AAF610_07500 [Pseudomonadota bacterium]
MRSSISRCGMVVAGSLFGSVSFASNHVNETPYLTHVNQPVFATLLVVALMGSVISAFWGDRRLLYLGGLAASLFATLLSLEGVRQHALKAPTFVWVAVALICALNFTFLTLDYSSPTRQKRWFVSGLIGLTLCAGLVLNHDSTTAIALFAISVAGVTILGLRASLTSWRDRRETRALLLHTAWYGPVLATLIGLVFSSGQSWASHALEAICLIVVLLFATAYLSYRSVGLNQLGRLFDVQLSHDPTGMAQQRAETARRSFALQAARMIASGTNEKAIATSFLSHLHDVVPLAAAAVVRHQDATRSLIADDGLAFRETFDALVAGRSGLLESVCRSGQPAVLFANDLGVAHDGPEAGCIAIVPARLADEDWAIVLMVRRDQLTFGRREVALASDFACEALGLIDAAPDSAPDRNHAKLNAGEHLTPADSIREPVVSASAALNHCIALFKRHRALAMPLSCALIDATSQSSRAGAMSRQLADVVARLCVAHGEHAAPAGRYGDRVLLVVMPGVGSVRAKCMAADLRETVRSDLASEWPDVRVSIGLVDLNDAFADAPAMLRAADRALYRARREGGNRVVHHRDLVRGHQPVSS